MPLSDPAVSATAGQQQRQAEQETEQTHGGHKKTPFRLLVLPLYRNPEGCQQVFALAGASDTRCFVQLAHRAGEPQTAAVGFDGQTARPAAAGSAARVCRAAPAARPPRRRCAGAGALQNRVSAAGTIDQRRHAAFAIGQQQPQCRSGNWLAQRTDQGFGGCPVKRGGQRDMGDAGQLHHRYRAEGRQLTHPDTQRQRHGHPAAPAAGCRGDLDRAPGAGVPDTRSSTRPPCGRSRAAAAMEALPQNSPPAMVSAGASPGGYKAQLFRCRLCAHQCGGHGRPLRRRHGGGHQAPCGCRWDPSGRN